MQKKAKKQSSIISQSRATLSLFPDGIYINPQNSLAAVSQYKLLDDNKTYQGGLQIFGLESDISEKSDLEFRGDFGIFDIHWLSEKTLISANENKKLSLFSCGEILEIAKELDMSAKCIFVDYDDKENKVYVALENGSFAQVDLASFSSEQEHKVHSDYVWMVKKQQASSLVFSGADDFCLSVFDVNSGSSVYK